MQPQPSLFFFTLSTLSHILSCLSTQQLSNLCGQQNSFNSHIETAYNFPIWQQSRRLWLNTACRSLDYLLDLFGAVSCLSIYRNCVETPRNCPTSPSTSWSTLLLRYIELSGLFICCPHRTGFINASSSIRTLLIEQLRSNIAYPIIVWLCFAALYMQLTITSNLLSFDVEGRARSLAYILFAEQR